MDWNEPKSINSATDLNGENASDEETESEKPPDENDDEIISSMHFEVKVSNRRASSFDTEYNDYAKDFAAEEYLSQMENRDDGGKSLNSTSNAKIDIGMNHGTTFEVKDPYNKIGSTDTLLDREKEQSCNKNFEFWCGYGTNIYFQPMKCRTLPLMRVKPHEVGSQMLRFSRRNSHKKKMNRSPLSFRLDVPVIKDALEDIGTLRIAENGKRMTYACSRNEIPSRVGNFILSDDLRNRLCKGFVCRSFHKSPVPTSTSHRDMACKDVSICAKTAAIPSPRDDVKSPHQQRIIKSHKHLVHQSKNVSNYEQDVFGLLPKMSQTNFNVDKIPRKKTIAGRAFHLANSAKTISKVNLFPFGNPVDDKNESEGKDGTPNRPLYPSPVPDEDNKLVEPSEEKVLVDHLRDMKEQDSMDPEDRTPSGTEDKYAYESMLSFYGNKVRDNTSKPYCIENTLLTTGLLSSPPKPKEKKSREAMAELDEKSGTGSKCKVEKQKRTVKKSFLDEEAGTEHSIHVTGKELNFTEKGRLPSELSMNERTPPVSRQLSGSESGDRPGVIPLHEKSSTEFDNLYMSDDLFDNFTSYRLNENRNKTVRFEEKESKFWSNEVASIVPFIAKSSKPVDRYDIPTSKSCRLPIIGQKITANTN